MQVVSIKNKQLLQILNDFKDWMFTEPVNIIHDKKLFDHKLLSSISAEEGTSQEFLNDRLSKDPYETGFPLYSKGFDIGNDKNSCDEWESVSKKMDIDMIEAIGVKFSALKMYYPEDGFIGWHNNCNCPGYNLVMSYSETGNGYFQYLDPTTKQIVRMQDVPGWSAKVGYFGSFTEPDKIFWHCARTHEPRITVSYVTPDQYMWECMIEDIQSE